MRRRRHSSAACAAPSGQGASLIDIDKSNVGRFDCVPSTCMHFPRLSGVFWRLRRYHVRVTEKAGRVFLAFACLCRM